MSYHNSRRFTALADSEATSSALQQRIRELKDLLHRTTDDNNQDGGVINPRPSESASPPVDQRQLCGPETYFRSSTSPPMDQRQLCGPETYVRPKPRALSPPTRESPDQDQQNKNINQNSDESKLMEETWQLLAQVTYVRVIIENIVWNNKCPKFIVEEAKHQRSPRERGQIYLQYQIPALTPLTPRGSQKTVKVVARKVSEKGIIFNDRHVVLCRMHLALVQFWAQNNLDLKLYYRAPHKKTSYCFAKCYVPLCKVLVLPFSFDSIVPLEMSQELINCKGNLKICVQLGSRVQYFLERVEPMRNPTTAVSPITFLDPTKINALVERIPSDIDDNHQHIAVEKHADHNDSPKKGYDVEFRESSRVVSPLRVLASARSAETNYSDQWTDRHLYPIISTQESSLHNGVWKEDFVKTAGSSRQESQRFSTRYGGGFVDDFYHQKRNETFLLPEENPPQPLRMAATSSPLPEVDPISFWKHDNNDDTFTTSHHRPTRKDTVTPVAKNTVTPITTSNAEVQTTSKVTADKQTESLWYSPRKIETATQTAGHTPRKEEQNEKEPALVEDSSNNSPSSKSCRRQSNISDGQSKKTTVAERLKTNLRVNIEFRPEHHGGATDDGRESIDPFVDLMSRSFILDKLRNNVGELNQLLVNIRKIYDDNRDNNAQSRTTSSWPLSSPPTTSRTVTLRHEEAEGDEFKSAVEPD